MVMGKMRPMSFWGSQVLYSPERIRFLIPDYRVASVDTLDMRPYARADYSSGRFRISAISKAYDTVWAGTYDTVFRASISGGYLPGTHTVRFSKNYGMLRMPSLYLDSAELTNPTLGWPQPGTYMQLLAGPKRSYEQIPNATVFFPYMPGDTLGQLITELNWGGRDYSRYVIRKRIIDSANQKVKFVFTSFSTGRVSWGDTLRFYSHLDSLAFPLRLPLHYNGATIATIEYRYRFDPNHLSLFEYIENMGMGYNETGTYMHYDTGSYTGCVYRIIDGSHRFAYEGGRGMVYGTSDFINEHRQDCYSINGQGVPCGRILLVSTKEGINFPITLKENPVAIRLEILSPTPLHLTLQDLQGRTVAEGRDTRTLDVRMLPPGLYQLRAQDKQGRSQVLRVAKD